MNRFSPRHWLIACIALAAILFFLTLSFFLRKPVLINLHPRQAYPGETISIHGRFLGHEGPRSTLWVANQKITFSHILSWSSSRISFRMPEGMQSGDVIVIRNQTRSNPILLTNINNLPRPLIRTESLSPNVELIDGQYESYWEVDGLSPYIDIYVDGEIVPSDHLFRLSDTRVGLYIPALRLWPDGQSPSGESLLQRMVFIPHYLNVFTESFNLRSRGKGVLYGDVSQPALYTLQVYLNDKEIGENSTDNDIDISIISEAGGTTEDQSFFLSRKFNKLVLCLPLPDVAARAISLEADFSGWVQLFPIVKDHVCIRLFPYNTPRGSISLNVHGRIRQVEWNDDLLVADDDYDLGGTLLPIYEEYLEHGPVILSDEQQSSLETYLRGIEGALPVARAMYDWLSVQPFDNKVSVLIDELRRRDIAVRKRIGYVSNNFGYFNITTWAELFLPRRGWVSIYWESMASGLPFASSQYQYIPLPLEDPFPVVYDSQGTVIEGILSSSIIIYE